MGYAASDTRRTFGLPPLPPIPKINIVHYFERRFHIYNFRFSLHDKGEEYGS